MQKYILEGTPQEVAKVIQENRIRVERGVISFTPVQPGTVLDPEAISEMHKHVAIIEAQNTRLTEENHALTHQVAELEQTLLSVTTVPENTETVLNDAENPENAGENVPETVPNDTDPMEDSKNIDVEDTTEANLDNDKEAVATSEDAPGNDTKDVPPADTKETAAPKTKRTKKAE